jgi:hypothetical protein
MNMKQTDTIQRRTFFGSISGFIAGSLLFSNAGTFVARAKNFAAQQKNIVVKRNPLAVPRKKKS